MRTQASTTVKPKRALPARPVDDDMIVVGKAYDPHIVRRLLTYLRPYRRNLAAALALMTCATVANVSGPYFIKVAIDGGVGGHNLSGLGGAIIGYGIAPLVRWVVPYLPVPL